MNTGFDQRRGQASPSANPAAGAGGWQGLRARLAAACSTGVGPATVKVPPMPPEGGSFDRRSARFIAVYGQRQKAGLGDVNPTALARGNSMFDKDAAVAGAYLAGD